MATRIGRFEISERESVELTAAGSLADVLVAGAAVLAALLGLSGMVPIVAAACASVAIAAGFLFEGGAIGASFLGSLKRSDEDSLTKGDVVGGMTADFVAGVTGLVCGAFALFGVTPIPLIGTAVLIYGASLLLGCAALVHATTTLREGVALPAVKADMVLLAAGGQLVVGLLALALGIIALLGTAPLTLLLVALLLIGASELATGMAVGTKMMRLMKA